MNIEMRNFIDLDIESFLSSGLNEEVSRAADCWFSLKFKFLNASLTPKGASISTEATRTNKNLKFFFTVCKY